MEILSRRDALRQGKHKYFTGQPCKNGHIAERYTMTCLCLGCNAMRQEQQRRNTVGMMQGVRDHTVKCHPHDWPAIEQFAWQLAAARGIHLAPPAPTQATPPAPAPTDSNLMRWQMWSRIHGEAIARQMFEQEGLTPPYRTNGS